MDKVILAFESAKTAERIRDVIEGSGLAGCILCRSAAEVKRLVQKQRVTTVICGYKLPDQTAESMAEDLPISCAVLVVAVQTMLDMVGSDDIFKLAAPVTRSDLLASVRMLMQSGRRMDHIARTQRTDEEQATVERTKRVLMERNGMSEEQAHRFLQKKSMDSGIKLSQTAQMILDGAMEL